MVTEEHHASMVSVFRQQKIYLSAKHVCWVPFGRMSQQVERSIVVQQEVVRSPSLAADGIWTLDGIPAEEDRLFEQ